MAVFKCKMCGGSLEVADNNTTATCEYCGTNQTVSKSKDEVIENLFNRANNLRLKSEFDKAQEVYEKIVANDSTDAEGYWGIVLCKYGIEYVEDPTTYKRIPTCHRTQIESVLADIDYNSAIENADIAQKALYEAEAKEIDKLQKDILSIAQGEEPFDVFICYKESDESGKRTQDSVIANDIYHQLTAEGFKVFYAAITLEDKLGREYEPYIFAALNSAKVMLVVSSKPEYFNAVWVKNEWSRYLKIIKNDRNKLLIPCYKDMDAYDLPDEFSHLQAQDMSKIGFINDVVRGIKKVIDAAAPAAAKETVVVQNASSDIAPLLKRAFMFLEDGDFARADEYCEKALDIDPENAEAYLGKLMVGRKIKNKNVLNNQNDDLNADANFIKAYKFADEVLKSELLGYRNESIYNHGCNTLKTVNENACANYESVIAARNLLASAKNILSPVMDYKDSSAKLEECAKLLTVKTRKCALKLKDMLISSRKEETYKQASELFNMSSDNAKTEIEAMTIAFGDAVVDNASREKDFDYAIEIYSRAGSNEQALAQIELCKEKKTEFQKQGAYNQAIALKNHDTVNTLQDAIKAFEELGDYRDSKKQIAECINRKSELEKESDYSYATKNLSSNNTGVLQSVQEALIRIKGYKNANELLKRCEERIAELENERLEKQRRSEKAAKKRRAAKTAKRASIVTAIVAVITAIVYLIVHFSYIVPSNKYKEAKSLMKSGKYSEAMMLFDDLGGFKDSLYLFKECKYKVHIDELKTSNVGDIVKYGYNDYEWIVLAKEENKLLLLSKDCQYDDSFAGEDFESNQWKDSYIRNDLNERFFDECFPGSFAKKIITTDVQTNGSITKDKLFLLSVDELNLYFPDEGLEQRAIDKQWLLRSSYEHKSRVDLITIVQSYGRLDSAHMNNTYGIRPAMWVNIE